MKKELLFIISVFCGVMVFAQTKITGSVYDIYLEPISSIKVTSKLGVTRTDEDGAFILSVNKKLPFKIEVSGVGYKTQTIDILDYEEISVVLEKQSKLQEIVISASRTPERILESPVTVERVGEQAIKNETSLNFYDNLANLRDIDVLTSGFGVKTINTRAFATLDNSRFVQLVDGADTSNPSYNFSLGNTMGLNELDVASVEILPGAASALYGANAFNGILLMNSKNPFDYGGINASFKSGITAQDKFNKPFYDVSIRMAHSFNNKLGIKANFNYLRAQEWEANDTSNTSGLGGEIISGDRESNRDYDGLNVYGDEFSLNFTDGLQVLEQLSPLIPVGTSNLIPSFEISREGYAEKDLFDGKVKTVMFDGSIYYRPFGEEDIEFIYNTKYGYGDNSYIKGNTRVYQKGAFNQQHKLDIKLKSYLSARAYYSNFNQGENSYNLLLLGSSLNNIYSDVATWYGEYVSIYTLTYLSGLDNNLTSAQASEAAHNYANSVAETNRPEVGTDAFNTLLNQAKQDLVSDSGAKLKNNSHLYHGDLNLNLTEFIKILALQLGGSYRRYKLNSSGQLYTDAISPIIYDEYGIYAQGTVKALDKRLSIASSIRYDKSENFEGNFSPRLSLTYAAGENRNSNFRVSYQTAFRNPTTEDQYGATSIGSRILALGNIESNYGRYTSASNPLSVSSPGVAIIGADVAILTGEDVLNNSYTFDSATNYIKAVNSDVNNNIDEDIAQSNNIVLLEKANIKFLQPEKVQTFELGYRGEFKIAESIFEIDMNGYYSRFDNYINSKLIVTPYYGSVTSTTDINTAVALNSIDYSTYAIRVNTEESLDFYGGGFTLGTKLFSDFAFSVNYMFSELKDQKTIEETIKPGFNTSKHRAKISFGNDKVFENFGFNVNARWQDKFLWQSPYINAEVDARTVLDAQINLTIPSLKSNFKLGGTNLLGEEYVNAPGLGTVGSVYYINWTINN